MAEQDLRGFIGEHMKNLSVLVMLVLTAGCGYVRSGEWENDAGNWNKAFRSTKPEDVVVLHSLYWRAPHWSFEAGYLFEIEPNNALRKQLFTKNRLRQLQPSEIEERERPCFGKCPDWFAPKPIEAYEVWGYADDQHSRFRILIDKSTGHIFLGDYEV